jgi:hypothetical protein
VDTRQRLLRLLLFWILVALVSGAASVRLIERVNETDHTSVHFYEQPVWSADENQIAYFRLTGPYGSSRPDPARATNELWRVDRQGDAPVKIAEFPAGHYRLAGWLQADKQLLVLSDQPSGPPKILVTRVSDGSTEELAYQDERLQLVGTSEGQLFFQRLGEQTSWAVPSSELSPSPTPSLAAPSASPSPGEVEKNPLKRPQALLLAWQAALKSYKQILGVPYENEPLSIDEAVLSPDQKWIALVLRVGAAGKERALWLYERDGAHLTWSGIRVPVDSMKLAWSPDSKGLVASTHAHSYCDLYVTYDIAKPDFHKLRSASGPLASGVEPYWPRDQHYFLLLRGAEIFQFDPSSRQATPMQLQATLEHQPRGLCISPRGTWAAYHFVQDGQDELSCISLTTKQTHTLVGEAGASKERNQWWYILGDGLRQAWGFWSGARM